jgi:hypothetical protein
MSGRFRQRGSASVAVAWEGRGCGSVGVSSPDLPASLVPGHLHQPIKHDERECQRRQIPLCRYAADLLPGAQWQPEGSVRHRRSLDQPIQRVAAHTLRSVVVVAAGWSEVAPTVPEETCDQEHPEEHPHQPWCAEDDSCDQCTDHNERCEPNHG